MTPQTKKYLQKRRSIANIIMQMKVEYDSPRNEVYTITNPDWWEARDCAEKILAEFGINKPKEVSEQETAGYSIG